LDVRMGKRRAKWISYFDMIDVFKMPGCPLCRRAVNHSRSFLESLFYERVTDGPTRVGLRRSKGFCNWHAWMSTELSHSDSGIAIIYKDLLDAEIRRLSGWAKGKAPPKGIRLGQGKKALRDFLSNWSEKDRCPVCRMVEDHERIDAQVLLDFVDEEAFSEAFEESPGVCLRHLTWILQCFPEHPNLRLLVKKQTEKYHSLSEELGEFIRKLDYRFSTEPKGTEVGSWKRALEHFAGEREVFGNEMDRKPGG